MQYIKNYCTLESSLVATFSCIHIRTHMYIHTYTNIHRTCAHTHTHTYTHTHTHTHTHIYTYTCNSYICLYSGSSKYFNSSHS